MSKDVKPNPLSIPMANIEGRFYRIMDFPREEAITDGPSVLRKAVAYRIITDMTKGLFPYRGVLEKHEPWSPYTAKVGIYLKENKDGTYQIKLAYPHSKKEREAYSLGVEKEIAAAVLDHDYAPDQFTDVRVNAGVNGEAFMPPVYSEDDPLNTLMKIAIRTKEAPFEPYGKRLEALAVDRTKGTEGINIRNNTRRGFKNNHSMSPSKFMVNSDTWQLEPAFILRDIPGAMHPMFTDGTMLVLFPNGIPFEIDPSKLLDITDMVADAINETQNGPTGSDDYDDTEGDDSDE